MTVEIRRSTARYVQRVPGRLSRHSLSFGDAYDPDNLRFGPMVCHDDHLLARGQGFDTHQHSELEIVTWVLSGALTHRDGTGTSTTVRPGEVALLTAGSGVEHSEVAAEPQTRFVQVWLTPDDAGREPRYEVRPVELEQGRLVEVAEPLAGATFSVARLDAGQHLELPEAPRVHAFVARGALLRSSLAEPLQEGDAFRFTDEPAHDVTAAVPSELLVWQLP